MKPDTKNYYLALALSVLVVFAWNYFYARPQMERARQAQIQAANQAKTQTNEKSQTSDKSQAAEKSGAPSSLPPTSVNAPPQGGITPATTASRVSRDQALAASPRISIDTPAISGSIALKGARIDDVKLKDYRETTAKNSPHIVLLSPPGAPAAYFVESGFVAAPGVDVALPNADTLWSADSAQKLTPQTPITLTWDNGKGLVFKRKIAVDPNYMFTVTTSVENKGAAPVALSPYSLVVRQGTPKGSGYSILHEGYVGVAGDSKIEEITYPAIEKEPGATKTIKGTGGWLGFTDTYWATALVPDQSKSFDATFSAFGSGEKSYQTSTLGEPLNIAAGASGETTSRVFAGAKVVSLLDTYEKSLGVERFDRLIDWGLFYFIVKPLYFLLDGIYKIVPNFGVAIIIVTFLVKLAFFPLANRSYMSMAKMKAAQPQLAALKERYPDDKMKQQQEMMAIYKREKINPVSGCLPMLIQIPVFFALYKVLFVTIEMRQAPFVLWIRDLSQPDPTNVFNLFGLIPFNPTTLPMIGHFLAIGILPLIMGVSMFLQMKMNPEPTDPVQKTMFAWMPVIFTFMLGTFPSGLVLYWTVNNTLTIIQQSVIMKRAGVKLELFDNVKGMFGGKSVSPPAGVPKPANDAKKSSGAGSKAPAE